MRPALLLVGAALLLSGCGAGGLVTKGDKDAGKKLFQQKCSGCHALAAAGASGTIGPNLDELKPPEPRVVTQVTNGGAVMPAFKDRLTKAQIEAVAKYVSSTAGK